MEKVTKAFGNATGESDFNLELIPRVLILEYLNLRF